MKTSFLFIALLLFFSCQTKSKERQEWEKYAEAEILKRIGKPLYMPDSILVAKDGLIDTLCLSNLTPRQKLVTYIDVGCNACLVNLGFWKFFFEEIKTKNIDCDFLIFINGGVNSIQSIRDLGFHYPVLLDTATLYISKNDCWDKRFQTALLNNNNEVVIIGDLSVNEKLKDLYIEAMLDEKEK